MLSFNTPINTDVLIVGGGIGGMCAAIAAVRGGVDMLLVIHGWLIRLAFEEYPLS